MRCCVQFSAVAEYLPLSRSQFAAAVMTVAVCEMRDERTLTHTLRVAN
uniref:Uncharacterized protein n=1 Tax=Anguilla anguilla TaxID=7936 RepID=A0A0E9PKR8_ANGAN